MNKWTVRFGAALLVVIIAVGAVGIVGAQGPDNPRGPRHGGMGWSQGPVRDRVHAQMHDSLIGVLAEMAGVEVEDLVKDASTFAELAAEYGLDPEAVVAEVEKRITDEVNQAVADGRLSEEAAAAMLDGLHARLVERLDTSCSPVMMGDMAGFGGRMQRGGMMGWRGGQTY